MFLRFLCLRVWDLILQVLVLFHCQVRVDLTGDDTEKVFDKVLTNLARTAPPVPGFRRQKGGTLMYP